MKILHLADLHIGKKVNDFSMIKDQEFVLNQALDLVQKESIEAVLISGDIFDRTIPPVSALELFNNFLVKLNSKNIKVFIISGNHDNMDRLSYLSSLLSKNNIFISKAYQGQIDVIPLGNDINIYLLPYLYPALIRKYYKESKIDSYNDSIKLVIDDIKLDESKFNILMAHQFVVGNNSSCVLSESEQKNVGGIDEIAYSVFEKFDYTALGHLHCPQKCGIDKVYYAGSILKYSFSEINQKKQFCVLDVVDNNNYKVQYFPIKFLHDLKEYRGYIDDFLDKKFYEKISIDDYIHFTLLDESVIDAKKKLSLIYPNIMLLDFDNSFTKNLNSEFLNVIDKDKSLLEHFEDFYKMQIGTDIDDKKLNLVKKLLNSLEDDK